MAAAAVLGLAVTAAAFSESLRIEFRLQIDPVSLVVPGESVRDEGGLSERERSQYRTLLDDARWAFSGMIYGFEVRWTPPARSRSVEDELSVEPLASIPDGDSRMTVVSLIEEDGYVYVLLEYRLDETQARRVEGWRTAGRPQASGSGAVSVFLPDSRRGAMEEAIKQTIRAWLRAREYNRPSEIAGRVAFVSAPEISMSAGEVRAFVSLGMALEPLQHYRID